MVVHLARCEMKEKQTVKGSMVMTREIDLDKILEKLTRMSR